MLPLLANLTETADLAAGLWFVLVISIACVALSPLLCWILPNRA